MRNGEKIKVTFPDGKERYAVFSWASIDYILNKYESMGEAYTLMAALTSGPMGITKQTMAALIDFLVALFIDSDEKLTPKEMKKLVPYEEVGKFCELVKMAVNAGSVEAEGNPTM